MVESRLGIATLVSRPTTTRGDRGPQARRPTPLLDQIWPVARRRLCRSSPGDLDGSGRRLAHAVDGRARCGTLSRVWLARAYGDGHRLERHWAGLGCRSPRRMHAPGEFGGAGP
jgi:hypothetical protein